MDSQERYENLCAVYSFLKLKFHARILIVRYAGSGSKVPDGADSLFITGWNGVFHRTKVINEGIKFASTKYVGVFDTDCVFNVSSIIEAVEFLRGGATLVYPYKSKFITISRDYIKEGVKIEHPSHAIDSVGGAFFVNKADYFKCGLENQNFISWAPEDSERYHRVKTLGYRIERADGDCYHIEHPGSENSGANKHTEHNNNEYMNITSLSKEDLEKEIATWEWAKM